MLRQTVSQSVCRGVKFTLEPVTRCYILSERCCVVSVGRPLWREVGSVFCQSLSIVFSPLSDIQYNLQCTCYMFYVYAIYTRSQSAQTQYNRSCQHLCYNSSLDAWTVVRLAAAKFKPLMFLLTSDNLVYYLYERSDVSVVANMRNTVFWYVVVCIVIGEYQHFRGTCYFLL
jgi:hypothetical protein